MEVNIEWLMEKQGADSILLCDSRSIKAVTGQYLPKGAVIIRKEKKIFVVPDGEFPELMPDDDLISYTAVCFEKELCPEIEFYKAVSTGISQTGILGLPTREVPLGLLPYLPDRWQDISEDLDELMLYKSGCFLKDYEEAAKLNRLAYDCAKKCLSQGMCSEKELYDSIIASYIKNSSDSPVYTGDFVSGIRSSMIGGSATEKVIQHGEAVILDLLAGVKGAYCDTTRTFFKGRMSDDEKIVYETVSGILDETKKMLRPGTTAGDIYHFIDSRIKSSGFSGLAHHAGHGVGYSWYERPYLIKDSTFVFKPGMLIALEPGIYIENKFGIRLENNFYISEKGAVDVFDYKIDKEDFITE